MAQTTTYDIITVKQGQCLLDIALQYYGTAMPEALINIVKDNGLSNITYQINPGDQLKIRNNIPNKTVKEYYLTNKINPSTALQQNLVNNLIVNVEEYGSNGFSWQNNRLSFNSIGFNAFSFYLAEEISLPNALLLHIQSNLPVSIYIEFGNYYIQLADKIGENLTLSSSIGNIGNIYMAFNYNPLGVSYNIELIAEKIIMQAS